MTKKRSRRSTSNEIVGRELQKVGGSEEVQADSSSLFKGKGEGVQEESRFFARGEGKRKNPWPGTTIALAKPPSLMPISDSKKLSKGKEKDT